MYAITTVPRIKRLPETVKQVWYADDTAVVGSVEKVRLWWDQLVKLGPGFGYYPNARKTWLVTKDQHNKKATEAFDSTGVSVTSHGRPYLGAPIGTRAFVESFVKNKVNQWISELDSLVTIAKTQPHAAHSAFNHGLSSEWSYITRTTPDLGILFQPLENVIRMKLIRRLTNFHLMMVKEISNYLPDMGVLP